MLLRSITKHVKDQNWFAVLLDFLIVVVGILIAFQITNWNEARQEATREKAILSQLEEEFTDIKAAIEKQNSIRAGYVDSLGKLVTILVNPDLPANDKIIKTALDAARATGRRPAQSAAYLQLMASGDLAMLSNTELQEVLVSYDARLKREAFIFPELMTLVAAEMSSNTHVDFDIHSINYSGGAGIDKPVQDDASKLIRSYNLDGLRGLVNRYKSMYVMNSALLESDKTQLMLASEILAQIQQGEN